MYVQTDHLIASNCWVIVPVTCLFVLENKGQTSSWRSTPPQGTPSSDLHGQLRETFPASDVGGSSVCQSASCDLWPHLHSSWLPVGLVVQGWRSRRQMTGRKKKKQKQTQSFSAAVVTFALPCFQGNCIILRQKHPDAVFCCWIDSRFIQGRLPSTFWPQLDAVFLNRCGDNNVKETWWFLKLISNFVSSSVNEKPRSSSEVRTPPSHFSNAWRTPRPVKSALLSNTRLLFKSLKGSEDSRPRRAGKVCFCVSVFVPRLQFSCFHGSAQRDDHSCHTAATVILHMCVCVCVCVWICMRSSGFRKA